MIVILLGLLITYAASAQSSENWEKKFHLKQTNSTIEIDGLIDRAWNDADSITDFFQLQPFYNQPPSVKTVVKVLTT